MGGLLTANLLRAIGWDVTVFERSAGDLASRGAGIAPSEALFDVMQRIGVTIDTSLGIPTRSRLCLDRSGKIIAEVPVGGMSTAWSYIYRSLKAALPPDDYRFNLTVKRVEQNAHGVTAEFADGSRATGDLLIAADGLNSTVRRQLLPAVVPHYAGYVVWRGVLEGRDAPSEIQTRFFEHVTFCFPEGELLLGMPNPGAGDDTGLHRRRYYFAWYRPADAEEALPWLCTDSSGRQHGVAIPPPLIRPEVIQDLRANAERLLAPQMAAVVTRTEQPLLQAIFDLESPQVVFGRIALLGDAAFVARPHVAAGVTKAALDAQSLVNALADSTGDLDHGLARYAREQRESGCRLVAHGRLLGAHLEAHRKQPEQGQETRKDLVPEAYMSAYGARDLVAERHRQLTESPSSRRDA